MAQGPTFTLADGTSFTPYSMQDWHWLFNYAKQHPEDSDFINKFNIIVGPNGYRPIATEYQKWLNEQAAYENASNKGDMNSYYEQMGASGLTPDENLGKAADNALSRENTAQAQDYNTQQRDTSLLSAASQLSQLGLSTSNVINTGGVQGPGVVSAASNMQKVGTLAQQRAMNKYNQQMGMAKSILGMVGQMASSGIYGSAIGAAKHSASVLAGATAHSAQKALMATQWSGKGNGPLLSGQLAEEWSKLPGSY